MDGNDDAPTAFPLRARLARLSRIARLAAAARGAGATLAALVLALLAGVALDWLLLWRPESRAAYAGLAGLVLASLAARFLWRPLRVPIADRDLLCLLTARDPETRESLLAWYELSTDPRGWVGGEEVRRRLAARLAREWEAGRIRPAPARLAARRVVGPAAGGLLAAAGVVWAVAALPEARTALARWIPGRDARWTRLALDPVPSAVAAREPLTVSGSVSGRAPRWVSLRVEGMHGEAPEALRVPVTAGRFRHTLSGRVASFRLRVEAGDAPALTRAVRVVRPPAVLDVEVVLTPPDYTGRRRRVQDYGDVTALEGTEAVVSCRADGAIAAAEILLSTGQRRPMRAVDAPRQWTGTFIVSGGCDEYAILLRDAEGLGNDPPPTYRVRAIPDRPPTVTWLHPARGEIKGTSEAALRIAFRVEDDIGLAEAWMRVERLPEAGPPRRIPAAGTADGEWEALLDVSALGARAGDLFALRIEAVDGRQPEPNRTLSKAVRLRVVTPAEMAADVDAALTRARESLDEAIDRVAAGTLLLSRAVREPEGPTENARAAAARLSDAANWIARAREGVEASRRAIADNGLAPLYAGAVLDGIEASLRRFAEDLLPRARAAAPADARLAAAREAGRALADIRALFTAWEDFNGVVRLAERSIRAQEEVVRVLGGPPGSPERPVPPVEPPSGGR